MEYVNLVAGVGLTATFIWLLLQNSKRISFINALLRVDTVFGLIAGVYLVFTSTYSLLVQ
jgi:hypothetical protein